MTVLRYLLYILACQFYVLRLAFFLLHSGLVFISKPGARLVIPLVFIGLVYLLKSPLELITGDALDAFWRGGIQTLLGYDWYEFLYPWRLEVSVIVLMCAAFVVLSLVSSMLRPMVGTFSAPKKPLPPLPPLVIPDTSVKPVKAVLAVSKRGQNRYTGDIDTLLDRMPKHLRDIVK